MTVQPGDGAESTPRRSPGVARSVEYLGSTVQVGIDVAGLETLSAVVPEARFDADPVAPGQPVVLSWTPEDVHVLGRLRAAHSRRRRNVKMARKFERQCRTPQGPEGRGGRSPARRWAAARSPASR